LLYVDIQTVNIVSEWLKCDIVDIIGTLVHWISLWTVMFVTTVTVIYNLGHGLHTFNAVPRL